MPSTLYRQPNQPTTMVPLAPPPPPVAEESKQLQLLAGRRALATAKSEDLARRIRELGSLPADAFKHKGKGVKVGGCVCGGGGRQRGRHE